MESNGITMQKKISRDLLQFFSQATAHGHVSRRGHRRHVLIVVPLVQLVGWAQTARDLCHPVLPPNVLELQGVAEMAWDCMVLVRIH